MAMEPPPPGSTPSVLDAFALLFVVALVFLAMAAIFLLHVLGPLRRRLSQGLLHHIVTGVYALSYPLVGYIIGQMQSSNWYFNDFTVWAVYLLLLLSSTDSLTACRLNDIDSWKSIYVKQLFKGFLLVSIVVTFAHAMEKRVDANYLWYPLSAIMFVIVIKSYVMIASMRMVSKSCIGKNVKVIAEYMQHIDNKVVALDPATMEGYRYMVAGEKHCVNRRGRTPWYKESDKLKVTTVEQIWQCEENLLAGDRGKALKDMCLSMALSKMLNRRFAGFKLSEAELDKTHDFVFKGLLAGDKPHERAFRVIEEELVFVHDMYYTRYSYLYQKGRYLPLCLPFIMFALCSWLTVSSLHVKRHDGYTSNQDNRSLLSGTIVITGVLAILEAYQLYLYMASGWFKVALIRSYVTTPFLKTSCCAEIIIRFLLMLKVYRPWKGRLGQYCFLENLGRKSKTMNCLHYATLCLVDKAMKGRKNSVTLSENVTKAIIDYLLESNGHLTNGVASLQKNGVRGVLSWACDATSTDGAVSRTILVWHIATTLCEHQLDKQGKEAEAVTVRTASTLFTVRTASTLSKYCMHLLAFAPNFLPDHSSISESILEQSIEEAGKVLEGYSDLESRCMKLLEVNAREGDISEAPLVEQGAHLARQIQAIQNSELEWKILSDFWVEMMMYVSPSDDARAHLEVLARGGEFITHLWALLTHAGILKPSPTVGMDVV